MLFREEYGKLRISILYIRFRSLPCSIPKIQFAPRSDMFQFRETYKNGDTWKWENETYDMQLWMQLERKGWINEQAQR